MLMRQIRDKTKLVMIVVAVAFVGWLALDFGAEWAEMGAAGGGELGRVNGQPVSYEAYMTTYQQLVEQARQQTGAQLSREQIRQIEEMAWQQTVSQMLIDQEMQRRGIRVTDAEIRHAARWNPHPGLMQNELFLTDGRFDMQKYQQFLSGPTASDELLVQLEQYYRETLPREKLLRQVAAGTYVSDAELWRAWRDRNETATVEYVALDLQQLVPEEITVTDDEVRARYRAERDRLTRPATARVNVAYLPKAPSAADTAAALEHARELRAEIAGGADFTEVARRESADPGSREAGGDLGTFQRGQMVPAFDRVAFSAPIGEVSEPVLSQFGYHLIQVQEREGDEARARHILIPVEPTEEGLDRLYARADTLEMVAEREGITAASARVPGAAVREGIAVSETSPFIPGVGSAVEAVEWAQDEAQESDPLTVSPLFETDQAFYVVEVQSFSPAGTIPLEEAAPQLRQQIEMEKRRARAREIGQAVAAEARSGRPLQEVAAERGLEVETAGPFSRVDPNPVFGQANAAVGAAFGLPIGQVSNPVETRAGLFLVRPVERTEADREEFEAQKEQLRASMMYMQQQEQIARWMEELRQDARIVDRRSEVLTRS